MFDSIPPLAILAFVLMFIAGFIVYQPKINRKDQNPKGFDDDEIIIEDIFKADPQNIRGFEIEKDFENKRVSLSVDIPMFQFFYGNNRSTAHHARLAMEDEVRRIFKEEFGINEDLKLRIKTEGRSKMIFEPIMD